MEVNRDLSEFYKKVQTQLSTLADPTVHYTTAPAPTALHRVNMVINPDVSIQAPANLS